QQKESTARVASIMENTNLSKQQQVSEIMRQMLTQAQTAGQYFTNDQIKEMTRKVSAEVDLVHQQTQNQRYGSSQDRKSGSAGMPRPISYAVFCLKKKRAHQWRPNHAQPTQRADAPLGTMIACRLTPPVRRHSPVQEPRAILAGTVIDLSDDVAFLLR